MLRKKQIISIVITVLFALVACNNTEVSDVVVEVENNNQVDELIEGQTSVTNEANSNQSTSSFQDNDLLLTPEAAVTNNNIGGELGSWESRCGSQEIVNAYEATIPFRLLVGLSGSEDKLIEKDLSIGTLDIGREEETYLSPDGQWLSIRGTQGTINNLEPKISLFSGITGEETIFVWSGDWIEPLLVNPWFTDEYIRLFRLDDANKDPYEVLVSNQGEEIPLIWDNLPNINTDEQYLNAKVSTTLSHVLYRTSPRLVVIEESPTTFSNLVLWDLSANKMIWESPDTIHPDLTAPQIAWSPNGEYVVFTATPLVDNPLVQDELYLLSLEGELVKLTNFVPQYDNYFFTDLVWSPDSRKILFTFLDTTKVNSDERFRFPLVYDLTTNSIWDFCLTTEYEAENPWSPDNKLIGFISAVNDEQRKLLIIDVTSGDILILSYDICTIGDCEPSDKFGLTEVIGWLPDNFTLLNDGIALDK